MNRFPPLDAPVLDLSPEFLAQLSQTQSTPAQCLGISRETLYRIANISYQLFCAGRLEQARQIYEGLVAADPRDSVFHCHLGAVYYHLGDVEKALHEFNEALAANPHNIEALAGRGEIHLQQKHFAAALADLTLALRLDVTSERAAGHRARTLLISLQQTPPQR